MHCLFFVAVSCNNLTNPDNGLVNISGMAFGSNAVYSCTTGYILEGTEERTCTANGTWSGVEPTCKIVDCLSLPKLINGVISYTTTTFNSTATYECNEGLILIGPSHRICQENTQWSGDQSLCVLDCGLLQADSITQIHYITSNVQRGLIAEYSCIPGYGIAGSNIRECREDGLWATNQPQCQAIDCGPLEPPLNGEVLVFNTTLANPARYSCRLGFELIGNEFRVCTINGLWSGISPTCRIIDCGDLPHPENGNVSLTGTIFTSQANYTCFPGYNVSTTQSVRVCTITGDWSGAEPSCTPVDCGPLEPPLNGDIFVFNTTLASPARYSCGLGFKLNGDEFRVCTINGTWSGPEPTCDVIDCGAPPTIPNGHVDFQTTTFASRANYTCNEGYTISGSSLARFCTDEEKWSGTLPVCTEILECPDPGIPVNGRRINDAFTIGSLVYYVCNDGYDIIGSNGRRCQVNGHWTGTPASCVQRNLSCTDNGPVFDSVGRQCTCVDGWMVNCCRYRQDWSNLSDEQRTRYVQAVLNVSSDPIYQPLYQTLMQTYYDSFQTLAQSLDFSITHFLPWHRFFMQQYEDLLRMIYPSVYIPYWDWTLLPQTPYQHLVFSPTNGFGNESDPNTDCITGGPFRQDQFSLSLKEGCLKRQYNTESLTLLTRSQLEDVLLVQPAFSQFFRLLTVPYLTVRCTVGGTMCNSKESPPVEDPLHLLILSFIDNIWNRWQSMNQQDKLHPHGDDILALANGFKVKDYNNVKNLPYNVSVCYGASADVSSSRQTRSINNYYSCNTQEWMEKLSLDENQRSVLRAVCRFFYTNIIRQ
jgi:CUB/sushi domain-containing protein